MFLKPKFIFVLAVLLFLFQIFRIPSKNIIFTKYHQFSWRNKIRNTIVAEIICLSWLCHKPQLYTRSKPRWSSFSLKTTLVSWLLCQYICVWIINYNTI